MAKARKDAEKVAKLKQRDKRRAYIHQVRESYETPIPPRDITPEKEMSYGR